MISDTAPDLDRHLDAVRGAPSDVGRLEMIVRRPARDEREVLEWAVLDPDMGLVGDGWLERGSRATADGAADPEAQITLIAARVLAAIEPDRSRWALAGDQLVVDLDLGTANLPAGTRLSIGDAILHVSATPHTGCAKFSARFGSEALRWINSPTGRELRLRGINARVVRGGTIHVGDPVQRDDGARHT